MLHTRDDRTWCRTDPSPALRVIAVYKLAKATALYAGSVLVFRLDPVASGTRLQRLVDSWHLAAFRQPLQGLAVKLTALSTSQVRLVALAFALYGALYTLQGMGLLFQRPWAEWVAIATGGVLIPFEAYESVRSGHTLPAVALAINVAIVVYLLARRLRARTAACGSEENLVPAAEPGRLRPAAVPRRRES
jgi:uncharacterized membrane protein (DUF2068 family)